MNKDELQKRTKKYALRIIKLVEQLPNNYVGKVVGYQLAKCGTSQAANYRAVCRARSKADFISKLGIVIEEADECLFWFEIIVEAKLFSKERMQPIYQEGNELLAIFISSVNTARKNKQDNNKS